MSNTICSSIINSLSTAWRIVMYVAKEVFLLLLSVHCTFIFLKTCSPMESAAMVCSSSDTACYRGDMHTPCCLLWVAEMGTEATSPGCYSSAVSTIQLCWGHNDNDFFHSMLLCAIIKGRYRVWIQSLISSCTLVSFPLNKDLIDCVDEAGELTIGKLFSI